LSHHIADHSAETISAKSLPTGQSSTSPNDSTIANRHSFVLKRGIELVLIERFPRNLVMHRPLLALICLIVFVSRSLAAGDSAVGIVRSALAPLVCGETPVLQPIPDKLVVLTFDDSVKSHFAVARPILKQFGFGATFFITEGFTFKTNKKDYMTWDEIQTLHQDGFEIGNHTASHLAVTPKTLDQLEHELQLIADRCESLGIPKPTSFAWPGNSIIKESFPILRRQGIRFARRGGAPEYPYDKGQGFAYEPGLDDPLLIPSAGDARPNWQLENFIAAVSQAREGKIAVIQFHGVPEGEHPWVHTPLERFEEYMRYLHEQEYHVIALRDLAQYVDPEKSPLDPNAVIEQRKQLLQKLQSTTP
jgi:peptidoglycan-N-acetylglucosamine deacetylase